MCVHTETQSVTGAGRHTERGGRRGRRKERMEEEEEEEGKRKKGSDEDLLLTRQQSKLNVGYRLGMRQREEHLLHTEPHP